tara:strand:+ start:209 stop:454 length:246 start_codon:yes stop_codon:yes gene_type:complete
MEDTTNYVRLAMKASNDSFAWFYFGVMAFHASDAPFNGGQIDAKQVNPQRVAKDYLTDNHPEVLECDKLRALARHLGGHAV